MINIMQDFLNKKVLIGVCGGIAAYKTAYLIRELTRLGAEVRVVMTQSAQQFITPLTLQALSGNDVRTDLWDQQAERAMGHIELARWADYLLIAPATANFIAKIANGIADDLLSTLYLVTKAPVLVCPAMNHCMWQHPTTQSNCKTLKEQKVLIVGPDSGEQACGETGYGRLTDIPHILNALRLAHVKPCLSGQHILITAGPTHEPIDPVRYLSNKSSGKMGYALAHAGVVAGARVTLISGPSILTPPPGVSLYSVKTAAEMHQTVMQQLKKDMLFIGSAAVADFHIQQPSEHKIKKQKTLTLSLIKNPDILADVTATQKARLTIGFAAETEHLLKHAKEKLIAKKIDLIIANQVGEQQGFDVAHNQVTVLTSTKHVSIKTNHKTRIAAELVAIIAESLA